MQKRNATECLTPLTPEQMEEHILSIEEGKIAHDAIINFQEWMFNSMRPSPPADAESDKRSNEANFNQSINRDTCHPCGIGPRIVFQTNDSNQRTEFYSNIANAA